MSIRYNSPSISNYHAATLQKTVSRIRQQLKLRLPLASVPVTLVNGSLLGAASLHSLASSSCHLHLLGASVSSAYLQFGSRRHFSGPYHRGVGVEAPSSVKCNHEVHTAQQCDAGSTSSLSCVGSGQPRRYAVLGGGFAGVAVAWHLLQHTTAEAPVWVDLFDEVGLGGGASGASGGLLHPFSPKGKVMWEGRQSWADALELLAVAEAAQQRHWAAQHGHPPPETAATATPARERPEAGEAAEALVAAAPPFPAVSAATAAREEAAAVAAAVATARAAAPVATTASAMGTAREEAAAAAGGGGGGGAAVGAAKTVQDPASSVLPHSHSWAPSSQTGAAGRLPPVALEHEAAGAAAAEEEGLGHGRGCSHIPDAGPSSASWTAEVTPVEARLEATAEVAEGVGPPVTEGATAGSPGRGELKLGDPWGPIAWGGGIFRPAFTKKQAAVLRKNSQAPLNAAGAPAPDPTSTHGKKRKQPQQQQQHQQQHHEQQQQQQHQQQHHEQQQQQQKQQQHHEQQQKQQHQQQQQQQQQQQMGSVRGSPEDSASEIGSASTPSTGNLMEKEAWRPAWVSGEEVDSLWPGLAVPEGEGGLYFREGRTVHPLRYLKWLWAACEDFAEAAAPGTAAVFHRRRVTSLSALEAEGYTASIVCFGGGSLAIDELRGRLPLTLSLGRVLRFEPALSGSATASGRLDTQQYHLPAPAPPHLCTKPEDLAASQKIGYRAKKACSGEVDVPSAAGAQGRGLGSRERALQGNNLEAMRVEGGEGASLAGVVGPTWLARFGRESLLVGATKETVSLEDVTSWGWWEEAREPSGVGEAVEPSIAIDAIRAIEAVDGHPDVDGEAELEELTGKGRALFPTLSSLKLQGMQGGVRALPPRTSLGSIPVAGVLDQGVDSEGGEGPLRWVASGLGSRGLLYHGYVAKVVARAVICKQEVLLPKELLLWKDDNMARVERDL